MTYIKNALLVITALLIVTASNAKEQQALKNIKEKPIVVVIPSYNNKDWYKKNLDSIFNQKYENYRVLYINDYSEDGTGELVEAYVKKCKQEHRFTLLNNPANRGVMANHYHAVHLCEDHEIVVNVDGDDWLKHQHVLQKINETYQDPNVWMTYGQFEYLIPTKEKNTFITQKGFCKKIGKKTVRTRSYRASKWLTSHLRTFYAGLFKHIKLKDFLIRGTFFRSTADIAMMMPMLEMANGKCKFIDEILYTYNCITPTNIFKKRNKEQTYNSHTIRSREKYSPLQKDGIPMGNVPKNANVDLLIFSVNPYCLQKSLESIYCYISGINTIYILYTPSEKTQKTYEKLQKEFKTVTFIPTKRDNFKFLFEEIISSTNNNHILLSKDTMIVKDFVNISKCMQLMEQTHAYGFYLSLGKNIKKNMYLRRTQQTPIHVKIIHDIYAWQFTYGEYDWRRPNNTSMTMYRKKDIIKSVKDITYDSYQTLEKIWNNQLFDLSEVGLFFENSKALEIESGNKKPAINIFQSFLLKNTQIKEVT